MIIIVVFGGKLRISSYVLYLGLNLNIDEKLIVKYRGELVN